MATMDQLIKKYEKRTQKILQLSVSAVTTEVITRTPVRTGSLRASWTAKNGPVKANNVNIGVGGGGRNDTIGVINSLSVGDTYSLGNGQHYARKIEYGGSAQQRAGMMRVAVARWQERASKAVRAAGGS